MHDRSFFQVPAVFFQLVVGGHLTGHGIEVGRVLGVIEGRELGDQPGALGLGLGDQPPPLTPGPDQMRLGQLAQRVPDGVALQPRALHKLADGQSPVAMGELHQDLALALAADERCETAEGRLARRCHLRISLVSNDHESIPNGQDTAQGIGLGGRSAGRRRAL